MSLAMHATKLVVRDADAAERFYLALGFKLVSRNVGGEAEVRQKQSWVSASGDASTHLLILSQFLELPPAPAPIYPGEIWICLNVTDVEAVCTAITGAGGKIVRAGQDRPEHSVRAAVAADPEGHLIEIVGPMLGR